MTLPPIPILLWAVACAAIGFLLGRYQFPKKYWGPSCHRCGCPTEAVMHPDIGWKCHTCGYYHAILPTGGET